MFAWIAENAATIIVCALLAAAVTGIYVYLIRKRKKGGMQLRMRRMFLEKGLPGQINSS